MGTGRDAPTGARKYRPYPRIGLTDHTWRDRRIDTAPAWCSVDLRDGNQAPLDPMDLPCKRELFELLARRGFREIEVGFPASETADWEFVRDLVRRGAVPADVGHAGRTTWAAGLAANREQAMRSALRAAAARLHRTHRLTPCLALGERS